MYSLLLRFLLTVVVTRQGQGIFSAHPISQVIFIANKKHTLPAWTSV